MRVVPLLLLLLMLMGCSTPPSPPPTAPDTPGARLTLAEVATGLQNPVALTHAGDGSSRLFVLEQPGRIRIIEEGKLVKEPYLDLTDRVLSRGNEQGLLGLAFAPDYAKSGIFYVYYTGKPDGQTVVARFRRSAADPGRGDADSEEILLTVPQPFANHNGGALLFGPDGYLYISLGDGGSGGDPGNRAQNLDTLLGKILRIDVSQPGPYRIPDTNPFASKAGQDEIWAYGLRNPWRIAFDRAAGDLWIADVGQNKIEEINRQPASSKGGENYGWRLFEGSARYADGQDSGNLVFPVAEYTHDEGGCSVTGGYVYRGKAIPALTGTYLYGDYCSGKIWGLQPAGDKWSSALLLETKANITAFGEDEAGELYVLDRGGTVYRLQSTK